MRPKIHKRIGLLMAAGMLLTLLLGAVPAAAAEEYRLQTEERDGATVLTGYEGMLPSSLVIPAGVTVIGEEAFYENPDLEHVVLPEGLVSVELGAFLGCGNLEQVSFPSTLVKLGIGAFSGCTSLRDVVLPDSLVELPMGAFGGCTSLESIKVPPNVKEVAAFRGCTELKHVELPEGLEFIGGYCFADCESLETIDLPASLLSIQDGAFNSCKSLKSLVIPEGPTYLHYTFEECSSLESLVIPASVTQIEGKVFNKCTSLKTIEYGGTKEAWEKALTYGNSSVPSGARVTFLGAEPPVPSAPGQKLQPTLRGDSGYEIVSGSSGAVLRGIQIGHGDVFTSVAELLGAFEVPDGTAVALVTADGQEGKLIAPVATGDRVQLFDADGNASVVTVVIQGDVLGTGIMNISQVVRMAKALNGSVPLEGPYLEAGSFSGSSKVTIGDLVLMARQLT